jgi:cytoskeleton protein RodZ
MPFLCARWPPACAARSNSTPLPVLGLLPQTSAPKLTYQGTGINAPFRSPGEGPGPSIWTQVSKQAVLAGLLLLLGALVLIFLPAIKQDGSNGKTETADTMPCRQAPSAGKPLPVAIAGPGLTDDVQARRPAPQHEPAPPVPVKPPPSAAAAVPLSIVGTASGNGAQPHTAGSRSPLPRRPSHPPPRRHLWPPLRRPCLRAS